jgi:TonB family protein
LLLVAVPVIERQAIDDTTSVPAVMHVVLPHIVFETPQSLKGDPGRGGGGGGNRQPAPIRHAEGRGQDVLTLRIKQPLATPDVVTDSGPELPALALDARPVASGIVDQVGLPVGGVPSGISTGPGSGGGVGTGTGSGIGPGRGPGVGPGEGGGIGGGSYRRGPVYRPEDGVSLPQLLAQVKPRYTSDALLRKVQGAVWIELIVTSDGVVCDPRVIRSLDPDLDAEAVAAVKNWRFAPGRKGRVPVDVAITVAMDFSIR